MVAYRRSYAGRLRGSSFEPRKVTRVEDLSEEDQEAEVTTEMAWDGHLEDL